MIHIVDSSMREKSLFPTTRDKNTEQTDIRHVLMFEFSRSSVPYPAGSASLVCVSVAVLLWSVEDGVSVAGGGAELSISAEGVELREGELLAAVSPLPEKRPKNK